MPAIVQPVEKVQFILGFLLYMWYNGKGDESDSKRARETGTNGNFHLRWRFSFAGFHRSTENRFILFNEKNLSFFNKKVLTINQIRAILTAE